MNRSDLQNLTKLRLKEARNLIKNKMYSGAYYLSGYAIECAIKSCIAKKINQYDFPNKFLAIDSYTHDYIKLLKAADLSNPLSNEVRVNSNFSVKWSVVKDWNASSRYELHNSKKARDMYNSIVNKKYGVLKWIMQYW
jgi:HEPN domain-containing protein